MKSLHIRNVPEVTIERLKRRAARHHRSLQGELRELLGRAADELAAERVDEEFTLLTVTTAGRQDWSREAMYED